MKGFFLAMLVAFPLASAEPVKQLKQGKKDLRQIQREISAKEKLLADQKRAEISVLRQLEDLNHEVDARRRDMRTHEHNLKIVSERLNAVQILGRQYEKTVAANRLMLGRELRLVHRNPPMNELRLLLSSREPAELISRYRFLKTMARHNAQRVQSTRDSLSKADEFAREYKARELELKNHKNASLDARRNAEIEKRRRGALLGGIRQKKTRVEGLLRELGQSAKNLENMLLELQRAAMAAAAAQRQTSKNERPDARDEIDRGPSRLGRPKTLPWPVKGKVLTRFGEQMHPKFRTRIFNRGIEIAAALGSPVMAVASGIVGFADYFEGYGQMLILDHGGGYFSVYGHNSGINVKKGEAVMRGQTIAEVGDSSTLGRSSLYFEIRSLAKAMDPLLWLKR